MPKPRKNQVCLDSTSYYHYISRCVRRLGIEPQAWLNTINHYDRRFFR